ncbi:MAG: Gfo/Idh/MocA family oxidoreductase [Planctomycetes bacterium]|nr:Gfo/Idh/MocA family oxidoreductase [Planctomycetota bacterium]
MGISIGLVGLGSFGGQFADLFMSHPLVDRVALCDREPERIRAFADKESWKGKFNRRDAYASLEDICKSDVQALVVITQHWLHAPQCVQAMEAGKHVYSAVPVITIPDGDETLEWCNRLVRTVRQTGLHYMLGETTYYHPQAMYCRRKAAEGAFGEFTYAEGEYFHGYDRPDCDLRDVYRKRYASKAGQEWAGIIRERYFQKGILESPMHYPTHSTSGPISVMNARAVKVSAFGQKPCSSDPYFDHQSFGNETALFQMSNGSTMRICEHRECSVGRETFRVYGTKGSFENNCWKSYAGEVSLSAKEMRDPLPPEVAEAFAKAAGHEQFYGGHEGSHAYLVHEFVDAIAHERRPAVNVWQAVRYMAAGVMAHKSALRNGEPLDVPDWGDPSK